MKKVKYLTLVFCLMFISILSVKADTIINETQTDNVEEIKKFNIVGGDNLNESNKIDGSSIVAGNNVTAENTVKGIDMVFGNNITYNGDSDYSLIAGNMVSVKGNTNNDSFIFGNSITFDKEYKTSRDLFVFGNSIVLRGEITRDVRIYAQTVILENVKISGNVKIYASSIEIKDATVEGTLSYNEDAIITISNDAVINAKDTFVIEESNKNLTNIILDNIIDYAGILLVFVVMALILPNSFNKIEKKVENISIANFISMLGYGIFFLIITPILFFILLMTTIGAQLAILLLVAYIIVISLSMIFTGYFVGLLVWKKFIKKETNMLLVGLIGISIIKVLSLIPYVGVITIFLSILLSLSLFVKLFTKDA